jgi:hypothetical protein
MTDPAVTIEPPPGPRTFWKVLVLSLGAIAVLMGVSVLAVRIRGRARRDAAIERLRASGAPVLPGDIRFPEPAPGCDPLEWIERYRVYEAREAAPVSSLPECEGSRGSLADGSAEFEFLEDLGRALDDPRRARELTPCQRAAGRSLIAADAEVLALALEVDELGEVDWKELVADGTEFEDLLPDSFVASAHGHVQSLVDAAWEAADRGAFDEALRHLESLGKAASFHRHAPHVIGVQTWIFAQQSALLGIRRVLQLAPPGLDLSALDSLLEEQPAAERIRFAVEGERAIGNRIFEAIRNRRHGFDELAELPWLERCAVDLMLDHGQANYLDRFERALAALHRGLVKAKPALEALDAEESAGYDLITNLLCPRFSGLVEYGSQLEVYRALTRARVLAYRDGTEAGLAWLASRTDPFGGAPFRHRREADGVVTMWSVGPDLVDDGAPDPPPKDEPAPDLVVRFRAAEDGSDGERR